MRRPRHLGRLLLNRIRTRTVTVEGVTLRVPPGVLDPVLFRSGAWFAREVAARVRELPGRPQLLDLGCGSGVVGLLAWVHGARVVATDIDPRAVAAARDNELYDVRQGDLFEAVRGERFDVVCFNPPYLPGSPGEGVHDRALYGGPRLEVVRRFGAEVDAHLSARPGRAWVCWSDRAPPLPEILGPGWTCLVEERVEDEVLSLWERVGAA